MVQLATAASGTVVKTEIWLRPLHTTAAVDILTTLRTDRHSPRSRGWRIGASGHRDQHADVLRCIDGPLAKNRDI